MLRILDVYPGSDIFPSRNPDPNFFHPGSASNNLSILTQKNCFLALGNMIRVVHFGSSILILTFYPSRIPDPGVKKKAPDPGSRSATLARYLSVCTGTTALTNLIWPAGIFKISKLGWWIRTYSLLFIPIRIQRFQKVLDPPRIVRLKTPHFETR